MWTRLAGVMLVTISLAGCSVTEGVFGESEKKLPGERIPVLPQNQAVKPDPEVAGKPVKLPSARANSAWPQPGGTAAHHMGHLALPDDLAVAWRADAGDGNAYDRRIVGQPVVAGGRVYTLDAATTVTAFATDSGARVWRRELATEDEPAGSYFGGGVAYSKGTLYVTTGDGRVLALDAETGERRWSTALDAPIHAPPTVHRGTVLVVTETNTTVALSASDGVEQWRHQGIRERAGFVGSASPAAKGSTAVTGYSSGQLFALLTSNGSALWNDTLASLAAGADPVADMSDVRGMPVIHDGAVYASSNANRTVAIDLRSGTRTWMREVGSIEQPWVAGNALFTVSTRANVYAMFRSSGKVPWLTKIPQFKDPDDKSDRIVWHGPVLAGGRVLLAGTNQKLYALNPMTGELMSKRDLDGVPAAAPVVADRTLYVLTQDATLLALRAP